LGLAREIQQSMLPPSLPSAGWFRACGSSIASHAVGGDYFDVTRVTDICWSVAVADVSGKGVSSALLASLLQGALITATDVPAELAGRIRRLNQFLIDRTGGEKYATIFYALLQRDGTLHYLNAAHCPPLVVRAGGGLTALETTGMPVGLIDPAEFTLAKECLSPGDKSDKIVIYSDGVTEAQSAAGEFFGRRRLREIALAHAGAPCTDLHGAIVRAVAEFTSGAEQSDDSTLLVLEYAAG
jgi:serine phosphatase RsbU (regulator of sigma subunit)